MHEKPDRWGKGKNWRCHDVTDTRQWDAEAIVASEKPKDILEY